MQEVSKMLRRCGAVISAAALSLSAMAQPSLQRAAGSGICGAADFNASHPALRSLYNTQQMIKARSNAIPEGSTVMLGAAPKVPLRAAAEPARTVTLWGHVLWASNWSSGQSGYGLHYFTNRTPLDLYQLPETNIYSATMSAGGVFINGMFYYVNYTVYSWGASRYLYTYDTTTTPWTQVGGSVYLSDYYLFAPAGVAVDPTTNVAYGIFSTADGSASEFSTVDYANRTRRAICTVNRNYVAFAINSLGECYAISTAGELYKLDKTTGASTLVGSTGVTVYDVVQSAAFDLKDDTLYWAAMTGSSADDCVSSLYTVDTTTGAATKIGDFSYNTQVSMLTVPKPVAEDDAPAAVTDLAAAFEGASTSGTVSFTMPTATFGDATLSGDLQYTLTIDDATPVSGTAAAGASVTVPVTVPSSGRYKFVVSTSNDAGKSPDASLSVYVGYGVPYIPSGLNLTIDAETGLAELTWHKAAMVQGQDGYLGDITFDVVRYPDNVVVAKGISEPSFSEMLSTTALKAYYYGVRQVNGDMKSNEEYSNCVAIGSVVELPFREDFNKEESYNFWTAVSGEADRDAAWEWDTDIGADGIDGVAKCTTMMNPTNDDWLISPPIAMEAGRQYQLSFNLRCGYKGYVEAIEVKMSSSGTDPADFTTVILEPFEFSDDSEEGTTYTASFSAIADGEYRIGFHSMSAPNNLNFFLDDVEIVAGAVADSPAAATDVTITPAAQGALAADIAFSAPTLTRDGDALTAIEKIEVYRNFYLVNTFTNPTPGAALSMTDDSPVNGINSYIITAYNDHGIGEASRHDVYIGVDVPAVHPNVGELRSVVDNHDGTFDILWPKPIAGVHDGFIDPDNITYTVYERGRYDYVPLESGVKTNKYTLHHADYYADGQSLINYGITADNSAGSSTLFSSAPYLVGKPYALPFIDSFAGQKLGSAWWSYSIGAAGMWSLLSYSYDDDGGAAMFTSNVPGSYSTFYTGKIDISQASSPTALFYYCGTEDASSRLQVVVNTDFEQDHILDVSFAAADDWQQAVIDLSQFKNAHYVMLGLRGVSGEAAGEEIIVDRVRVFDRLADNLAAEDINVADVMRAGVTSPVKVRVANLGENVATDFDINIYIGGRLAGSLAVESLDALAYADYVVDCMPLVVDDDEAEVSAQIVYAADMCAGDNVIADASVVRKVELQGVALSGRRSNYGIDLTWSAPAASYDYLTEDFESYEPFAIDDFAPWITIDGDGATTYFIDGLDVPGNGTPKAFQLFNPSAIGGGLVVSDDAMPHSGDACLISYNPAPTSSTMPDAEVPDADDWLISPELPGVAQTIEFYAKSLTTQWGVESFEILYSVTGHDTADFIKIGDTLHTGSAWQCYTAQLPEGARYFAVHVISHNKYAFMIDDISYLSGESEVIGYNVYRDGALLQSVDAATCAFRDSPDDRGLHSWFVTALYGAGESMPSNIITADTSAVIDALTAADEAYDIYTLEGIIVGTGLRAIPDNLPKGFYVVNKSKVFVNK